MSKKLRENPSKAAVTKAARGSKAAVKKLAGKTAQPATKSPVRKTTKKVVKKTAPPAPKKISASPSVKAPAKAAAKPAKPAVAAKQSAKPAVAVKPPTVETATKKPALAKPAKPKIVPVAAPAIAEEGARAPAFNLPRDGGATVSLADYADQKLVIFFYPRANTPGCTKEAIDFTRLAADFAAAGTAVLGVSADPLKAQESFRDKHDLTTPLLSDETHGMLDSYGAWGEKSMYGKAFQGVFRTTVLIDASGIVRTIWRGVKVDGHAEAVLAEARRI